VAATSFGYTGAVQTFTVPDQCTSVTVDLWGANNNTGTLVRGGRVTGVLATTPGEVLRIYVGGEPASYLAQRAGGWNGGGDGGTWGGVPNLWGCPGSGATDIRQGGTALSNRKAVAGGAGGGINTSSVGAAGNPVGGAGGAGTGGTGANSTGAGGGAGGTQAAGGAAGGNGQAGSLGNGGNGGTFAGGASPGGGGAGGGYYGGGGGGGSATVSGGGGGGSNYVGGLTGVTNNVQASAGRPAGVSDGYATLTYNLAPNAPTLSGPASSADIDVTAALPVTWAHSDPDGDAQSKADVQWRVGSGAWTVIASASASATASYTFPANTFSSYIGQSVEWQVRTYDTSNAVSPWSASSYFTPRTPPAAPTVTWPASIASNTPTLPWAASAPGVKYTQARVLADSAGAAGAVLATGPTNTLAAAATGGSVTEPNYAYVNGTAYHLQVRVAYYSGVWSAWADSGAVNGNINAPPVPTITVTVLPSNAAVTIATANGTGTYPAVSNSVYRQNLTDGSAEVRVAANLPINGSWTDWQPPLNAQLAYRVQAYSASGGYTSSA
jgi:hypothetical protein